jgi:hypothetical protein
MDEQAILQGVLTDMGLTLEDVDDWFIKEWSPRRATLYADVHGNILKIEIVAPPVTKH